MKAFYWLCLLALSACSGGAVVFVPTPLPPDVSPIPYAHPSGAFDLVIPRNWALYEQESATIAAASFAPPDSTTPIVRVAVVNLGKPIEANELGELMLQYQTQVRPDRNSYTEQDRQPMGDGSWRMTGVRMVEGVPQAVNTFLQREGNLFGVLEVVVPQGNPALLSDVQLFVNTFRLKTADGLPSASLSALEARGTAPLEVLNVRAWTSAAGVFFISGEVANRTASPYASVPVRAALLDANGTVLAEAEDKVMGHVLAGGSIAPFSLRFGEGQPPNAITYALTLGGELWNIETLTAVSAPTLAWTDEVVRGTDGQVYISGTVTNTGMQTLREGMVIVTVFDANGQVIGAGFAPIQEALLAPNGTSPYNVLISETAEDPARYSVTAQALP